MRTLAFPAVLVIGLYAALALGRPPELGEREPRAAYYNLLVDGFRRGQLSLAREAPPALVALANPYDPQANAELRGFTYDADRLHDLTYFKGRLYLYFGVTPALAVFWPAVALTGRYLGHDEAVFLLASVAFLIAIVLLADVRRRYLPGASAFALGAGAVAIGLCGGMPIAMTRPEVWEVPIVCGAAFAMLSLWALWRGLHATHRAAWWAAAAGLSFGLAVGSRPTLALGAPVVAVLALAAWPDRKRAIGLAAAALVPLGAILAGLAAYNFARFGDPLEFGQFYQLAGDSQQKKLFDPRWAPLNVRTYLFSLPRMTLESPFLAGARLPTFPAGHGGADVPYGILTCTPFVLLAGFLWRKSFRGGPGAASPLRRFVRVLAALVVTGAGPVMIFYVACVRYQLDFLPPLLLLAAIGLCALDQSAAGDRARRRRVQVGAAVLLFFSSAFVVGSALDRRAGLDYGYGEALAYADRNAEAERAILSAVRIRRSWADGWMTLAVIRCRLRDFVGARDAQARAVLSEPAKAPLFHLVLGSALAREGQRADAVAAVRRALELDPAYAEAAEALRLLTR